MLPDPRPAVWPAFIALLAAAAVIISGADSAQAIDSTGSTDPGNGSLVAEAHEEMPATADPARLVAEALDEGTAKSLPLSVPRADGLAAPATSAASILAPAAGNEEIGIGIPGDEALAERIDSDTVRYSDPGMSTEFTVQPASIAGAPEVSGGVRTLISVLDADAPEQFAFPVDLPDGVALEAQADGSISAVDQTGAMHGTFAPPWAVDANGKPVPTRYEVAGNTLVQQVSHAGAAYPIIADPVWFVPVIIIGARVAAQVVVKAATRKAAQQLAKKAAVRQGWAKSVHSVKKVQRSSQAKARSHARSNHRHNLQVRTQKNPKGCQAHHTLPVKFAREFSKVRGLNINDPRYALWWTSARGLRGNHASMARAYNAEWQKFFSRYGSRTPSKAAVLQKRAQLVRKYQHYYRC